MSEVRLRAEHRFTARFWRWPWLPLFMVCVHLGYASETQNVRIFYAVAAMGAFQHRDDRILCVMRARDFGPGPHWSDASFDFFRALIRSVPADQRRLRLIDWGITICPQCFLSERVPPG